MLYYSTIDQQTLDLLKTIQSAPFLFDMRLVGGTALALQLGHRKSIDIDLFGKFEADEYELTKLLGTLGELKILKKTNNILACIINGINVDIVNYHYPWLSDPVIESDIKLSSIDDIAAMKLAAVAGRGTKKDFIDIFFLLKDYSLEEMLGLYNQKFRDGDQFLVLKSLLYFDDANMDPSPDMIVDADWNEVMSEIKTIVQDYIR